MILLLSKAQRHHKLQGERWNKDIKPTITLMECVMSASHASTQVASIMRVDSIEVPSDCCICPLKVIITILQYNIISITALKAMAGITISSLCLFFPMLSYRLDIVVCLFVGPPGQFSGTSMLLLT